MLSYKQIIQYCFGREFIISVENQNPCPYSDTQIITGDVGELNNQVFLFIFFYNDIITAFGGGIQIYIVIMKLIHVIP